MAVVDCFTFYNGLDVLEVRLNSLAPYVDRFVLCESPYDMMGKKKPLYFEENRDRFKDFNIVHLVVQDHEEHMGGWTPYYYQIDYMMTALDDLAPDDIVMISDFDEIPDLSRYDGREGIFKQELYYYYFNVFTGDRRWRGTYAIKKKNLTSLSELRRTRKRAAAVGSGWHFSYISTVQDIIEKIEAFCHQELNRPEIKACIEFNKANLIDPFNRGRYQLRVKMPDGPKWLLENRERYEQLWLN